MKRFPNKKNDDPDSTKSSERGSQKSLGSVSDDSDQVGELRWSTLKSISLESSDSRFQYNNNSNNNSNSSNSNSSNSNSNSHNQGNNNSNMNMNMNTDNPNLSSHLNGNLNLNLSGNSTPNLVSSNIRRTHCNMSNMPLNDLSDNSRAGSIMSKANFPKSSGPNRVGSLREWVTIINKFAADEVCTVEYYCLHYCIYNCI
jgi:hypothetical protein